ncbi:hypothetical protein GKZ89_19335 [Bacillus mangrovi]|uniref:Uncharacterized protein n=1 Tax=Metabacillus mangrovi TaxID=1491830 RepID=A0A7X2SAW2_9BACI|nr:hypothetical protein [Metabacillus mangrovi]MTH55551.1 hypothetical protein [Metabacillus mangrovi]
MSLFLGLLAAAFIGTAIVITLDYLNRRVLEQEASRLANQYQNELGSNVTAKLQQKEYNVFDLDLTGNLGSKKVRIEAVNVDTQNLYQKIKI